MSALVFMDTETTGLSLEDDIWEFAAIRREEDGTETRTHLFIQHDGIKCAQLPDSFWEDHDKRFPGPCSSPRDVAVPRQEVAAHVIAGLFTDRPHIVGAVPNFDTERIALLLRRYGLTPGWHYHLIDVENLAVGYLAGVGARARDEAAMRGDDGPRVEWSKLQPPWDSDALSRACGVEPPTTGRHTAMGDAEWAMALYDAITKEAA